MRKLKDTPMNRAVRKYQSTTRGKRNLKRRLKKWRAINRFNRDTISMFKPLPQCNNCVESYVSCPVEQGSESIRVCPAWQEYKRTNIHPNDIGSHEPAYDPDMIDFEYIHED